MSVIICQPHPPASGGLTGLIGEARDLLDLCDAQLQRYANNLAEAEPEIAKEIAAAYGEVLIPTCNAL